MFLATGGLQFSSNDGGETLGGYLTAYVGLKAAVVLLVSLIELPLLICFLPDLLGLQKPLWLFRTFFLSWALSLVPAHPTNMGGSRASYTFSLRSESALTASDWGLVSPLSYRHLWSLTNSSVTFWLLSPHRRQPCTVSEVFHFCWVLFIYAKGKKRIAFIEVLVYLNVWVLLLSTCNVHQEKILTEKFLNGFSHRFSF